MSIASLKPTLTKFRPLGNRLVVQRLDGPKEEGGIILPESQIKIGLIRAKVLMVGTKVPAHHKFKPGAVVHIPPQLGYMKFILNGDLVDLVPTDQVYAMEAA